MLMKVKVNVARKNSLAGLSVNKCIDSKNHYFRKSGSFLPKKGNFLPPTPATFASFG
jgi:hypothetical protein